MICSADYEIIIKQWTALIDMVN